MHNKSVSSSLLLLCLLVKNKMGTEISFFFSWAQDNTRIGTVSIITIWTDSKFYSSKAAYLHGQIFVESSYQKYCLVYNNERPHSQKSNSEVVILSRLEDLSGFLYRRIDWHQKNMIHLPEWYFIVTFPYFQKLNPILSTLEKFHTIFSTVANTNFAPLCKQWEFYCRWWQHFKHCGHDISLCQCREKAASVLWSTGLPRTNLAIMN